jgi:hypothetical protein
MIVRMYRALSPNGGWQGVLDEIRSLVLNPDRDARAAGMDFARALKSMVSNQQMFAVDPLPMGIWRSQLPALDTLWWRTARKHNLYLSHIKVPPSAGGPEVRALLAIHCRQHEPGIIQEVVNRHLSLSGPPGQPTVGQATSPTP